MDAIPATTKPNSLLTKGPYPARVKALMKDGSGENDILPSWRKVIDY